MSDFTDETYKTVDTNWCLLFGKNKGKKFNEVDENYLKWCYEKEIIKNDTVNEYIKRRLSTGKNI